jgi:predicted DNA-binding transcriptional regulator AlpA
MRTSQPSGRESAAAAALPTLLNEFDVARVTGLSVASVRRWRLFGKGPKYLKIGAAVRYRAADVQQWLDSRPTGGAQEGR